MDQTVCEARNSETQGFAKRTDTGGRSAQGKTSTSQGPLVLKMRSVPFLSTRLEAFLLMGGKQRLLPKMIFFLIERIKSSDNVHFAPHTTTFEKRFLIQFANSRYSVLSFLRYSPTMLKIFIFLCSVTCLVLSTDAKL